MEIRTGRALSSGVFSSGYGTDFWSNPNFQRVSYLLRSSLPDRPSSFPTISPAPSAPPLYFLGSSAYNSNGNTGMGGIMFDIKALHDVEITQLTWQFNGGYGSSYNYKCYKKTALGPHTDTDMFDSSKWTLIASGSAENVWDSGAVTSPFSVQVRSGEVQAFYIYGGGRGIVSQDGGGTSTLDVYKSDENMEIRTGRGLFSGGVFSRGYGTNFWSNPKFQRVSYLRII